MFSFFKPAEPDPKPLAKELFEKVTAMKSESHEVRNARLRLGMLIRAHVDKTFVAGAEQTANWQERVAQAIVDGEDKPEPPKASEYQEVKSGSKSVWVYLPIEEASFFFELGARYQRMQMDAYEAVKQAQTLMDRICFQDLKLETPFSVLQFLRDEIEREQPQEAQDLPEGAGAAQAPSAPSSLD